MGAVLTSTALRFLHKCAPLLDWLHNLSLLLRTELSLIQRLVVKQCLNRNLNFRKYPWEACRRSQSLLLNSMSKLYERYDFRHSKEHGSENFPEGIPQMKLASLCHHHTIYFLCKRAFIYKTSIDAGYVGCLICWTHPGLCR